MKTAVVTGAYSEIGLQICKGLASQGYKLICQYSSIEKNYILQNEGITDFISAKADFSDDKSVKQFIDFIYKKTDTVDILVHCAAKHEKNTGYKIEQLIFDVIAHVNLFSPIFITQNLIDLMKKSGNPCIIFVSSTYYKQLGSLKNIYYASTKTALHTVSRIFAREYSPVRSNVIVPGFVDTPTYNLGRNTSQIDLDKKASLNKILVSPQAIVETVLFIIKNKSINGTTIDVDGGLLI